MDDNQNNIIEEVIREYDEKEKRLSILEIQYKEAHDKYINWEIDYAINLVCGLVFFIRDFTHQNINIVDFSTFVQSVIVALVGTPLFFLITTKICEGKADKYKTKETEIFEEIQKNRNESLYDFYKKKLIKEKTK